MKGFDNLNSLHGSNMTMSFQKLAIVCNISEYKCYIEPQLHNFLFCGNLEKI